MHRAGFQCVAPQGSRGEIRRVRDGGVEHEGVTVEVVAREEGLLISLEGTIIDAILQFIC